MKRFKNGKLPISLLSFVMALIFVVSGSVMAYAATNVVGSATILRVEYQGQELSRDRQNPTFIEWVGDDIPVSIIGNSACAELNDLHINCYFNGFDTGSGFSFFDSNGISTSWVRNPSGTVVGNDTFEAYWNISGVVEKAGNATTFNIIPSSESPKYYITFSKDTTDYEVPPGNAPSIVRAELNNVELSQDKNNPTVIPYLNNIKLAGNFACISKEISVQYYTNGTWTWGGFSLYFNSNATSSCSISAASEYAGGRVEQLYNEIVNIEFAIHDEDGANYTVLSKSPTYYVVFLDEESNLVDFEVNGLFQTVRLSGNQLIIETEKGYVFDGCDIILKDKTENKEYKLGVWFDNPDCAGVLTNRIVYSNLPLKKENIYELTIPARAIYFESGLRDFNTLKYNKEYTTELIMDGANLPTAITPPPIPEPPTPPLTFQDVPTTHWAYDSIMLLVNKGVISGYPDGTFKPNTLVTRSEFAKMMYLALEIDKTSDYSGVIVDQPFFADMTTDNWEYMYVKYVGRYMTGFQAADGKVYFKGGEAAVREDMAVALVKTLGLDNQQVNVEELKSIFTDYNAISPNLQKHVLIAYKNGLISGYTDGTFGAQKSITRAEAAALLVKVLKSEAMQKITFN